MNTALAAKGNCFIEDYTTDLSTTPSKGRFCTLSAATATQLAINPLQAWYPVVVTSATTKSGLFLIADTGTHPKPSGGGSDYKNSLCPLGAALPPMFVLISAQQGSPIPVGSSLVLASDGGVIADPGSGARVVVGTLLDENTTNATGANGANAGDLVAVQLMAPVYYAS